MATSITFKVSKLLQIAFIAAITSMSVGCKPVIDTMALAQLKRYGADAVEETRIKMGHNLEPPPVASVIAYQTNDPELKIFLSYIGALENGLEGIRGESMDTAEYEASQKKNEEAIRKSLSKSPGVNAYQRAAALDRALEESRKKNSPPVYLKVLPAGADPKGSRITTQVIPIANSEGYDWKFTTISVVYRFKSTREMTRKANEIENKLRPVIATQQGWKIDDLATAKKQLADYIEISSRKELQKTQSPEYRNKNIKMMEDHVKRYEAGNFSMTYTWHSPYVNHGLTMDNPHLNAMNISIIPQLELLDGYYRLTVTVYKYITQPRNKS